MHEHRTLTMGEVVADRALMDEIIACYIAIFNATGAQEWGEQWTPEAVQKKLFDDVAATQDRTYVTTLRTDGTLTGLSITVLGPASATIVAAELPAGHQTEAEAEAVRQAIGRQVAAADPGVIYFRELGIRQEFRGGLKAVLGLILDAVPLFRAYDPQWAGCWTSRQSRVFSFLSAFQLQVVHDFQDAAGLVFIGNDFAATYERMTGHPLPP